MTEIRRILCPVDFSDTSRHALEHATAVARWYGAQIIVLHVIHVPLVPQPPILGVPFAEPAVGSGRDQCQQELQRWLAPVRAAGVPARTVVDSGSPAGRIVARALTESADLIVMGTHGLSGFERFMLGSVAERVLRTARCPVMTVPPASVTKARVPYTRLLCPVDFSPSSEAALRVAFSLAEEADANLTLLHVLDWPPEASLLTGRFDATEFNRALEDAARLRITTLVPDDVRVWCKPATRVVYGKPYTQILKTAGHEATDLIVIGVRGRNPIDQALFGSTTNQVVRRAPCPVLTLRS